MMIDIDYFKQYNDTYGHHQGDTALISVANSLKKSLKRPEDYVFRLGGEEFCVITSEINKEGTLELEKRIKSNIESLLIEHIGSKCSSYLTASIGIKIVSDDLYLDYDDIYKLADDALYEAKDEGRNKIIVSKNRTH